MKETFEAWQMAFKGIDWLNALAGIPIDLKGGTPGVIRVWVCEQKRYDFDDLQYLFADLTAYRTRSRSFKASLKH